jgi:hypothetical protein
MQSVSGVLRFRALKNRLGIQEKPLDCVTNLLYTESIYRKL